MSDNLSAHPDSRLLALPSEICLLIYEQLFPPCKVDIHKPRASWWVDNGDVHATSRDVAILKTYRTIYKEAAPTLYENTVFYAVLAVGGSDSHEMSRPRKRKFYSQLLQDLQGRVRQLTGVARKVSISILLAYSGMFEKIEHEWFQQMSLELNRLGGSSELKELHITFEASGYYGPPEDVQLEEEVHHVIHMLGEVESQAAVTVAVHPSLSRGNSNLLGYLSTLAKLRW